MRISLTLLFAVVFQLTAKDAYAQRTRVAISMSNVSVEQVLNKIEETSDFVFLYNDKDRFRKTGLFPLIINREKSWIFWKIYLKIQIYLIP